MSVGQITAEIGLDLWVVIASTLYELCEMLCPVWTNMENLERIIVCFSFLYMDLNISTNLFEHLLSNLSMNPRLHFGNKHLPSSC